MSTEAPDGAPSPLGSPAPPGWTRDPDDIVRAHDILAAVLLGEVRVDLSEGARTSAQVAIDVLCWVLEHTHNPNFALNLAAIEAAAEAAGYQLRRKAT